MQNLLSGATVRWHGVSGVCQSGKTPKDCVDNNPCTKDTCEKFNRCVWHIINIVCDDNDTCTQNDSCWDTKCSGTDVDCDDGKPCTADSCDGSKGCVHVTKQDGASCDDGKACSTDDKCAAGMCKGVGC